MVTAASPARPFIGRLESRDALRQRTEALRQGHGGFTLVVGEAGVGKSTLMRELAEEVRTQGTLCVEVRPPGGDDPPPLSLIREAVSAMESAARRREASSVTPGVATGEPVMIGFAPRMAGGPSPSPWSVEERIQDAMVGPTDQVDSSRARLFATLAEPMARMAERDPLLFVVEDIHRADSASLEFLEHLVPTLADRSLAFVATSTPLGEVNDLLRPRLERLVRHGRGELVTLRSLTAQEMVSFVRVLDEHRELGSEEVARWHTQTGGNPLFVEQLVRRDRNPALGAVPTSPEDLQAYMDRQFLELSPDENRILALGAVLGREFAFSLLLAAAEMEEEALTEVVERLVHRGLLRERPDESLQFIRDDFRQRVAAGLTESRRRLLHRRAGAALESLGRSDPQTTFALARHFELGRADEKSWVYNRLAGELAAASFAPSVARDHFRSALEAHHRAKPDDLTGEVELSLGLAFQLDRLGELDVAERTIRELLKRHPDETMPRTQRWLLRIFLARILSDQGLWDEVDRATRELQAELPAEAPATVQLATIRLRGEALYYQGQYTESLRQHDEALAIAERLGQRSDVALARVRRANVLAMIPERVDEAVATYRSAVEELQRMGDLSEAAYARLFLGITLSQLGRAEEGLEELHESYRLAETARDQRRMGWALFDIADLELGLNRREAAAEHNRRSKEILTRIGDRFGVLQTLIVDGKIGLSAGNLEAAERDLLEAFRLSRELNAPADEVDAVLRLAQVSLARGDLATARRRAEELSRRNAGRLRPDIAADLARLNDQLRSAAD